MRRPPLVLILLSVLLLALGTTGGAAMSLLRPQIQRASARRIFAAREIHNLSGSWEYDAEVVQDVVFTVEAGLSFFHTHGEGMGVVLLFAATAAASLVARPRLRAALHWLLGLSFLFPVGYVAYSTLVLFYGKDTGIRLAERLLLIPFGSSAVLGLALLLGAAGVLLVNGRRRDASPVGVEAGTPTSAVEPVAGWRRPPPLVVLAAALLITVAEISGASMARFKPQITAFATARILERPAVHGLVGVKDVDDEILDEALVKLEGALRLFHLHGEGMGLVIFSTALVISTLVRAAWLRKTLLLLTTVGSAGFPFGYLFWSVLIPFLGVGRARSIAAALVLIPFGALVLVTLWALSVLLARDLVAGGSRGEPASGTRASRQMSLPPLFVVVAAMLLVVLAEVGGGAMVKFKVALDRANRERIEARPTIHGLVGVREVDGPVVDALLSRADFAFRLFHLHGEGMGLVIFAGGLMVRNFLTPSALRAALYAMLVGGFFYPFGYLAWSGLIPVLGLQRSKDVAEYIVWIPFGGAALVAMGVISLVLGRGLYLSSRERGERA